MEPVFLYGYEDPAHEAWAWDEIAKAIQPKAQSVWCGDVRLAEPETDSGIIGCGVLLAKATMNRHLRTVLIST